MAKSSHVYNDYVDLTFIPDPDHHLIAKYRVQKNPNTRLEGLAYLGSIAAESSTGTWTHVTTQNDAAAKVSGKVFQFDEASGDLLIAYPTALFEPGNLSQLLTVVAGNAFGLADIAALKLIDISVPLELVEHFPGPALGAGGIKEIFHQYDDQPLIGAIMKPKCGLSAEEHAELCFAAWTGAIAEGGVDGVDMVKDDEALTSQNSFRSNFYTRILKTLEACKAAEDLTGRPKIYVPNITHSNMYEALKRAEYVEAHGGRAVMIDYVIGGGSLLHTIRLANLDLIIHGHRTLFAAMHRAQDFGVDYMVWAKLFRMLGGDQMHTGTPSIGVMQASQETVLQVATMLSTSSYQGGDGYLPQKFGALKTVLPICGAGLDPTSVSILTHKMGTNLIMFAGGGCHGHPDGTKAGAATLREAVMAMSEGVTLEAWTRQQNKKYLTRGFSFFSQFDKQNPNDGAREHM